MRARTFVFALVCGTATAALAQDSGYVRFPSSSPEACAVACSGDRMCASWSFGTAARSYGQSQTRAEGGGMCTFSGSSTVRSSPGMVSGLPRREAQATNVPMMSAPPNQGGQPVSQQPYGQGMASQNGASGWSVRPAPWLSGGGAPQQTAPQPTQQPSGMPQQLRPMPPMPAPTPSGAPRIEYEPQNAPVVQQPVQPQYVPPQPQYAPPQQPVQMSAPPPPRVYVAPTPAYVPPPVQATPQLPPPPPRTQAMPSDMMPDPNAEASTGPSAAPETSTSMALPTRTRPGSGVPKGRTKARTPQRAATPTAPAPAPAAREAVAEPVTPQAAPARQVAAPRPAPGRGTPRAPARNPNDPESFRGADGMIDAAEMRRAQINAARDQGTPAYSVQREWEAVAAERQRADEAGEVRVDPLAGTVPVAPPPETRAERRAREAEEAVVEAQEARDAARAAGDDPDQAAPATQSAPKRRGARGTPRPKSAPRQTSQSDANQQVASAPAPRRLFQSRRKAPTPAPVQALDREPRLSGGPG
jgi:hypothetical protein